MTATVDRTTSGFTVSVPTERGDRCLVDVTVDAGRDTYTVAWSGELLDLAPEALTATIGMAMLAIRSERATEHCGRTDA